MGLWSPTGGLDNSIRARTGRIDIRRVKRTTMVRYHVGLGSVGFSSRELCDRLSLENQHVPEGIAGSKFDNEP